MTSQCFLLVKFFESSEEEGSQVAVDYFRFEEGDEDLFVGELGAFHH